MKAWEIWSCQPAGWNEPHPAVIVSHPLRVAHKPEVDLVMCSTRRAQRAPKPHEVLLDESTGKLGGCFTRHARNWIAFSPAKPPAQSPCSRRFRRLPSFYCICNRNLGGGRLDILDGVTHDLDIDVSGASVEQRDEPALKGKPVMVGSAPNPRGGISP